MLGTDMTVTSSKTTDVLIAGGGIAGLLLARALLARGKSVIVANDPARPAAAQIAAGLINPVMGRRCTLAWEAPTAIPIARRCYGAIGAEAGSAFFRELPIVRYFVDAAEKQAWAVHAADFKKAGFRFHEIEKTPEGLSEPELGGFVIEGGGVVDGPALIEHLRAGLRAEGRWIDRACVASDLVVTRDLVRWSAGDVAAKSLVLAGGAADIDHPFAEIAHLKPVKGELVVFEADGLDRSAAYLSRHYFAPMANGQWVCGATQVRGDSNQRESAAARADLKRTMERMLAVPWETIEQRVGTRTMTPDMHPVVGPIREGSNVFLFQGLGSRGFSLAPWLADALATHMTDDSPLPEVVVPSRFAPPPTPERRWVVVHVARDLAMAHLQPGDVAVDLTVGNGNDTLWLAETVGSEGEVFGFDVQKSAIDATEDRLSEANLSETVRLYLADHSRLKKTLPARVHGKVALVVANLGYLPGSGSPIVTQPDTTLAAFAASLEILRPAGALVAVIYTGHVGGPEEKDAIEKWTRQLDEKQFSIEWIFHPGGEPRAPRVLVVRRR